MRVSDQRDRGSLQRPQREDGAAPSSRCPCAGLCVASAQPVSPGQLAWLRRILRPPRCGVRAVALGADPSRSSAARGLEDSLKRALSWPGIEPQVCSVPEPAGAGLAALASPRELTVVLATRGPREEAARWALRSAAGATLVACDPPPADAPIRLELSKPSEVDVLLPWLEVVSPDIPLELVGRPVLGTTNGLVALRELDALRRALDGARGCLPRSRSVTVRIDCAADPLRPASLVVRVRRQPWLRRWLRDGAERSLAAGGAPVLSLPPRPV